jgi:hypothetical protein
MSFGDAVRVDMSDGFLQVFSIADALAVANLRACDRSDRAGSMKRTVIHANDKDLHS